MASKWVFCIAALARAIAGPSSAAALTQTTDAVATLVGRFEALSASTTAEEIAAQVDSVVSAGRGDASVGRALLAKLRESNDLYQGRGPKEVTRLRGYMLAALAEVGPPPESLGLILSELAYGHEPYLVAAAARAAGALGSEKAVPHLMRFLGPTFEDDEVSFEKYDLSSSLGAPTTARLEVTRALERIEKAGQGGLASIDEQPWLSSDRRRESGLDAIRAVDQTGREILLRELHGHPFVLTFFYTRCDNPNKCSLTMAQLGRLQEAVRTAGLEPHVSLVAVTLDPAFDTPLRLRTFAETRGVVPSERVRVLRVVDDDDFKRLLAALDVPVAFGHGQVSGHGVELLLFDARARYVRGYAGALWDNAALLQDLIEILKEK